MVVVSNKIESEVAELEDEERIEFLQALNLTEPGCIGLFVQATNY